ncbi:hypothetical protein [Henriciella mobilis]|uniref:Uncharacterized protein n=1 Tax=Henriciella mobilis TaxID=2305467 RepID=A0A399RAI4_9PROT|nr:hypothetical protein [Henriciella mobilis]RIJ28438.1 hypothetical protein D1223_13720 [Henriciella mobilis]
MQKFYKFRLLGLSVMAFLLADIAIAQDALADSVNADQIDQAAQAESSNAVGDGRPVQFIYGSGVNSFTLQRVVESVEEAGCPVTTKQLSDTDRIIVKVAEKTIGSQDVVFAGMFALENCK